LSSTSTVSLLFIPSFNLQSLRLSISAPTKWLLHVRSELASSSPSSLMVSFPGALPKPYAPPLWSMHIIKTLRKLADEAKVDVGNIGNDDNDDDRKKKGYLDDADGDGDRENKEVPFVLIVCKGVDGTVSILKKESGYSNLRSSLGDDIKSVSSDFEGCANNDRLFLNFFFFWKG
jgi:hypothetical protein